MSEKKADDGGFSGDESVEQGVWRYARATRASVIVDAEHYFAHMQQAMLKAQDRILLIGWDFDSRIHLTQGRRWYKRLTSHEYPARLGSFVLWLNRHRKGLDIKLLKWSYGVVKFFGRGSMALDLIRFARHKRIDFKFDTAHPVGCSHHQKLAVLDGQVAVCGGIDMTTFRWDTREHREDDPRRKRPRGKPYGPWHDATMMLEGPIAGDLEQLGIDRWSWAGGEQLERTEPGDKDCWPEKLEVQFENVEIGIARTRAEYDERDAVREIEELFEKHIAEAKHFIYAETQYFASRKIADAVCRRLSQPDPPEIFIVHPCNADGWLEQQAMDHARAQLVRAIGENDPAKRFNLMVPYTGETPIYVHAKLMIIDDRILRIGSANMNNRSMGLDSECDLFIDCSRPGNESCGDQIARLRYSLLAEHCSLEEDEVPGLLARYGSMIEMVDRIGTDRNRTLQRLDLPELNAVQEKLADSELLDPECPDDMFEPFAEGGLFRERTVLQRMRDRIRRRKEK
ncbi:phospholipase D-like domain-containing protein [Altererythrobacter sp. CAU 1778]